MLKERFYYISQQQYEIYITQIYRNGGVGYLWSSMEMLGLESNMGFKMAAIFKNFG